jgi:hypothetical protein
MNILEESRMMLELAISSLQRAGHDTEQFERTVSKIKALKQGKKLPIDSVIQQRKLLNDFVGKYNASTEKFEGISEDSIDCYFKGIL